MILPALVLVSKQASKKSSLHAVKEVLSCNYKLFLGCNP